MGNIHIWGQNEVQFKRQVTFLPSDPQFSKYLICQDRLGRVFLGCQIDLYDDSGKDAIIRKLQLRKNQNSYLYPINGCYFQKIQSMCYMQKKCLLTCLKPKYNLRQIWRNRLNEYRGFSCNQIHRIINNISRALKALSILKQTLYSLNMDNILVNDNVYLMDHLMESYQDTSDNIFDNYPSPQDLDKIKKVQVNYQNDRLCSNLFSLGMIALQLCHMKCNLKGIYKNVSFYESGIKLNNDKLQQFVNNVNQLYLQAKLRILTHPIPEQRKTIYTLVEKETITFCNVQFYKREVNDLTNINNKILEHKIDQQVSFLPSKMPVHSQAQSITFNCQQIKKPRIYFQFINQQNQHYNYNQNLNYNQRRPSSTNNKENLQNSINREKVQIKQKHPTDKSWIPESTPQKQRKKILFSTIKQESEAEECFSSVNPKYFDQLCISGKFQGLYENGKKQGWGQFYFKQGSVYDGQWKGDCMNGYGKLYYPNGKLAYEGGWINNQFNGLGKVYNCIPVILNEEFNYRNFNQLSEEWITYEGNLVQDKKQGYGCLTLSNHQYFEGQFLNDHLDGQGTFFTKKGLKIRGMWKNSQLIYLL